jgi:Fic family protein
MNLFDALGFHWERSALPVTAPTHSTERVAFRLDRMLPEFVWDASVIEGNPFTYPEVKTLIDGVTIGGRKVAYLLQILNLAASSRHLLSLVKTGAFALDKPTFTELHALGAYQEAPEWGVFRGEGKETSYTPGVGLGGGLGHYMPLPTVAGAQELTRTFHRGVAALDASAAAPIEKAFAFFLFGALQQFFLDGNERTSRFMMNGILMSAGIDAVSVPAAKAETFNEKMARFFLGKDATEMMAFLVGCHPDADLLRAGH